MLKKGGGNKFSQGALVKIIHWLTAITQVKLLIDAGADVNAQGVKRWRTPLHMAMHYTRGHTDESTDILELLIASGANLFAVDVRGRLPLHYAFVKINGGNESKQFDPIEICTLLTSRSVACYMPLITNRGKLIIIDG